jgi:hypothetical protein
MDPTSDSRNDRHGARQPLVPAGGAARIARTVAVHLAHLFLRAAIYLGATALDSIYALRLGLLMRSRAKFPDRVGDLDTQMARLREQRSSRWSSWKTLSAGRRMEIRFAAAVLALAAILGLRAYLTGGGRPAERVAHQPTPAHAPSAPSPRGDASTPSTISEVDQALIDAERFREYRKQAAPGRWIVFGAVESVESASARLAEAQAQKKAAEAAWSTAYKKTDVSSAKVEGDKQRRESLFRQHASREAFSEVDRVIQADQAAFDADRAAWNKADDRRNASQSAEAAAEAALHRAQHPVVRPVLTRGEVDQWDGFKVMSPVVIKDGNRYRMWYVGCHFIGDDYTCGVGHAQSSDGITWEKSPRPVLTIEDPFVSQDLHSITVVRAGDEYLLWYALYSNLLQGRDCSTLNLATSSDGLAWKPQGLVLSTNCQAVGHIWQSAFYDGKTIHLWYADYDDSPAHGSLMHLVSSDGKNWQKAGLMDMGTLGIPGRLWVMPDRAGYRALFAARDQSGYFGMLQSPDGNNWIIAGGAPKLVENDFDPFRRNGDDGVPEAPVAIVESGGTWMWFAVPHRMDGSEEITMAFQKEAQQ